MKRQASLLCFCSISQAGRRRDCNWSVDWTFPCLTMTATQDCDHNLTGSGWDDRVCLKSEGEKWCYDSSVSPNQVQASHQAGYFIVREEKPEAKHTTESLKQMPEENSDQTSWFQGRMEERCRAESEDKPGGLFYFKSYYFLSLVRIKIKVFLISQAWGN